MNAPTHSNCPGPPKRRAFLKTGLLGLAGLSMGGWLKIRAQAGTEPKQTACIFVWLGGGPSHLETYDLKPSAPEEFRGPFRPIPTRVPGMAICELMPRQAQVADRFALIRSCSHQFFGHGDGSQQVLTGRPPLRLNSEVSDYPDLGSIFKRARPPLRRGLPQYVALPARIAAAGPAYLGQNYEPFPVSTNPNAALFRVPNISLSRAASERLQERRLLLREFDALRRDIDTSGVMEAMDHHHQEAVELLTGDVARQAFDLRGTDARERDRYGRTRFGQSLFLARRLVEAGVGFVLVDGSDFQDVQGYGNWDDHAVNTNIFDQMRIRLPILDQGIAALVEDLYARGLNQRVLLVVTGEFGRSPRIETANGRPGRDHHAHAMSILVSGGGMRMGQVIGSTEARGERPRTRPLHPTDLLATIYHHLGIDPRRELLDYSGRPLAILPRGEPIRELVG